MADDVTTDQETVVSEQLILVDADGNVTTDREQAVRGEVVETLASGSVRSTLFVIEGRAAGQDSASSSV